LRKKSPQPERSEARAAATGSTRGAAAPRDEEATQYPTRRRAPGRTRSDASRLAILNAALKLLETQNLQQITIESIAREAEVGKATIYRWWPSKASIVIEAFVQNHIVHTQMHVGRTTRDVLCEHMHSLVEQYGGWPGKVVGQILAEGQSNPQVLREFRERFFYGRRSMVREVLEEGRRRGEVRTDMDTEMLMDLLYASVYFRLMMQHLPLDPAFADQLSDTVLKVIEPVGGVAATAAAKPRQRAPA
jgi:AcrR family transcriptional regulator